MSSKTIERFYYEVRYFRRFNEWNTANKTKSVDIDENLEEQWLKSFKRHKKITKKYKHLKKKIMKILKEELNQYKTRLEPILYQIKRHEIRRR